MIPFDGKSLRHGIGRGLALAAMLALAFDMNVRGASPAFPLNISASHRFLEDQHGRPFLYHADTPWLLFFRPTLAEVDFYLTDRKNKGFTTLQLQLLAYREKLADAEGEFPLHDLNDLATPNDKFFRRVERIMDQATTQGFYLSIAPAWLGCCEGSWRKILQANGPAKCREFGRYLGRRFARFQNVMWILGGDIDPGEFMPLVRALAEGLKETAPHQLLTAHPGSPMSALQVYGGEPWLDVNCTYTYSPDITSVGRPQFHVYAACLADYHRTPVKPFVLLETAYENERHSRPQVVRRQAYWAYLSGACGHALGNLPIYTMDPGWKEALQQPGSRDMAHLATLFASLTWSRLLPDQKHEWVVAGYGTFDGNAGKSDQHASGFDYVAAAADPAGSLLLAYLPTGEAVTVDLSRMKGTIRARWFDPTSGQFSQATPGTSDDKVRSKLKPPGKNATGDPDWVLVVRGE